MANHDDPWQGTAAPPLTVGHDAVTARSTVGPTATAVALTMAARGSATGRVMSTPPATPSAMGRCATEIPGRELGQVLSREGRVSISPRV